jgi:hypothetical protein
MILAVVALLGAAETGPAPVACGRAYESAQEHRAEGRLRAAEERLLACAQASCPAFIRGDCTRWLAEVQAAQPTVVFAVRRAGRDVDQVAVTCDGARLPAGPAGRAIPIDPGKHTCRFEPVGAPAASLDLLVVEGQKSRLVQVDLPAGPMIIPPPQAARRPVELLPPALDTPPAAPPPPELPWNLPIAPLALAGGGALGLLGFVILGTSGLSAEHHLETTCAPACSPGQVSAVRSRYLLADISLAVGVASAVAAGAVYWRSREPGLPRLAVGPSAGGATVSLASSF